MIREAPTPKSIALIGSYIPRQCGIATFTADLREGLKGSNGGGRAAVVALNDPAGCYRYPREVAFEIQQEVLKDYEAAAAYLNSSGAEVACVQHEFGIFGGPEGRHLLTLLERLRVPVATTLHSIPKNPSPPRKRIIQELGRLSQRLVALTETGRRFLIEHYGIAPDRISVIPHGVPNLAFTDPDAHKGEFKLAGRKVILTFGLLSPGKGLEGMVRAFATIAGDHPDAVYVILGKTHPAVRREQGEAYREGLQQLARQLRVGERVIFRDSYVDTPTLCRYLGAADVYVTPYPNEEQIVSGTLALALGAGLPVVSTPYWHAAEALRNNCGRLVPFGDIDALAREVGGLLGDDAKRAEMRKSAYRASRDSTWNVVADRYRKLFSEAARNRQAPPPGPRPTAATPPRDALPELNFDHLIRLTDDTGILQHADRHIADRRHGYCVDDNARALLVCLAARSHGYDPEGLDSLAARYLAFLRHAYNPRARVFRNFMGYDRRWTEAIGSHDSCGRALWALGAAAAQASPAPTRAAAAAFFKEALEGLTGLRELRAVSFALLGLAAYHSRHPDDAATRRARDTLAEHLDGAFALARQKDWPWPETRITYANAQICRALIETGRQTGSKGMLERGLRSLTWLVSVQTRDGHFSPVGNEGWFVRGGSRARFDQQPLEADATAAACAAALQATGDSVWRDRAMLAFEWFLGRNDLGLSLYNPATGGCHDGLHPKGISDHQGAESTLAYLSALLIIRSISKPPRSRPSRAAPSRERVAHA